MYQDKINIKEEKRGKKKMRTIKLDGANILTNTL